MHGRTYRTPMFQEGPGYGRGGALDCPYEFRELFCLKTQGEAQNVRCCPLARVRMKSITFANLCCLFSDFDVRGQVCYY